MIFQEQTPHPSLKAYIRSYYFFSTQPKDPADAADFRFVSDGGGELIVNLGDPFHAGVQPGRLTGFRGTRLIGPLSRHLVTRTTGRTVLVAVRFLPGGMTPFFRFPADDISDDSIALDDIFGSRGRGLEEKVRNLMTIDDIRRVLDRTFYKWMSNGSTHDARMTAALKTITSLGGQVGVQELADGLGMSRRHLERRFLQIAGMSPKRLCRIVRFNNVLTRMASHPNSSWADMAVSCGFSDQAHLIRECRFFTGYSPMAYLRNQSPFEKAILAPDTIDPMSHLFNTPAPSSAMLAAV